MSTPQSRAYSVIYVGTDHLVRARVARYLQACGMSVVAAASDVEAQQLMVAHRFDVAVLDTEPRAPVATDLIRDASSRGWPAVIILGRQEAADEAERIVVLEAGADAYLTKPLSARVLAAHVRAVCRRLDQAQASRRQWNVARFDGWVVDLPAHRATSRDRVVTFTAGEVGILRALLERPFVVCSRQALLTVARRSDVEVFDRAVDVFVSRVRHKLEVDSARPVYIETVRRAGYRFACWVTWDGRADVTSVDAMPPAHEPAVSAVSE